MSVMSKKAKELFHVFQEQYNESGKTIFYSEDYVNYGDSVIDELVLFGYVDNSLIDNLAGTVTLLSKSLNE